MTRADMERVRAEFVRAAEMAGARRLRLARATLRARLSDVVLHHAADQQAQRRIRRQPGKPHALSARSFSRVRKIWPDQSRSPCVFPRNTGSARPASQPQDAVTISRTLAEARRRSGRCLRRPDLGRGEARLRPHVPDAVLRPYPQRGRHRDARGRQYLRTRPRQFDPDGRPGRPRLPRATASCRPDWTLHAAADLRYEGVPWPKPYRAGRDQLLPAEGPRRSHDGEGVMDSAGRTSTCLSPGAVPASARPSLAPSARRAPP